MSQYFQTEGTNLGRALQMQQQQPGQEAQAAGAYAQSARNQAAAARQQMAGQSSSALVLPGSGAYAARLGNTMTAGAGNAGVAATAGRMAARSSALNRAGNIVGQGQQLVGMSDSALNTAASLQAQGYLQNLQSKTQEEQDFANTLTQIGSMGGGASSAGGMGGMFGGGGAGGAAGA
jgi:hypothetical protein